MESTQEKILVFGGGFNPPTIAHQAIMAAGLQMPGFKELWVMPSGDRADKHMASSDSDRLQMLELIKKYELTDDPRLVISDFELQLPQPTQTCRTVAALALAYSQYDFWFIFGADAYLSMPAWDEGERLQKELNMVLVARGDSKLPKAKNIRRLNIEGCKDVSSTSLRQALRQGQPIDRFVCQSVKQYIDSHKLYQTSQEVYN